jgi:chromate transporter
MIQLFIEFLKTGLFSFGGYASIPFLYDMAERLPWFDAQTLTDMIAVSESTPGPVGVNMATYAGFHTYGILGGITTTAGFVLPSVIIIIFISKFLERYNNRHSIDAVFYGLRPAATGLIASAALLLINLSVLTLEKFTSAQNLLSLFDVKSLVLFVVFIYLTNRFNRHPFFFIAGGAAAGILFKF